MNILVVVSGPAQGSGVRSAAASLTSVFQSLGHRVDSVFVDTRPREAGNRVNVENLRRLVEDVWAVARAARRDRADLVWVHSLGFPVLPGIRTLAMVLASRLVGRRAVAHLHAYGLDPESLRSRRGARLVLEAIGWLSATVVVLHRASADAVRSVVPERKVAVVRNIVVVPPEPTPLPFGVPRRLLFVGGLVRRKGVPELLDAMRLLGDDFELHLVGGPGEDGIQEADQLIRGAADLVAAGQVEFEGELDDGGVREELRSADVFVLPSRAEGTPIGLLEAMAEGRPVVVSDAGNMAEVVGRSECGVVLTRIDATEIAQSVRAIFSEPAALQRRAANGHRTALDEYSVGAGSRNVAGLLRSLDAGVD